MQRYFFNIHDGHSNRDTEGTELPDRQAARCEAIGLAGHILKDEAKRFLYNQEWWMEVTDVAGRTLFKLEFCLTEEVEVKNILSVLGRGQKPPECLAVGRPAT